MSEPAEINLEDLLSKTEKTIISGITRGLSIIQESEDSEESTQSVVYTESVAERVEELVGERSLPEFGPPINQTSSWEIPIVLIADSWPELKINSEGIYLTKGFYKLEYTFSNVHPGSVLAVFEQNSKQLMRVLDYLPHHGASSNNYVIRQNGTRYLRVNQTLVVGLVNNQGGFRPKDFKGAVTVTIHKLKQTPN